MLDQPKLDGGLSFLERCFRRVLTGNRFAVLRGGRHQRLALRWLALLQPTEFTKGTEQPIQLVNRYCFLKFGTGAIQ